MDRPDTAFRSGVTMTATALATAWLRGLGSREGTARQRLFVFPHAGAGASAYRLAAYLPDSVEVCTVQMPGRESRFARPTLTSLDEAVATLAPLIANHAALPYAFFGHSMGSLLAFETARRLRALGTALPDHLFLSGMRVLSGSSRTTSPVAYIRAPGSAAYGSGSRMHDIVQLSVDQRQGSR
ncbi:thioesterase II family protein [Streptomyces malaysiensis]|uniref:thioesterase II family protein n=1 Tax=Streptomyces malaysiensis TaxID=92644 RepID=UPI00321F639E|nr:alpha/beta fold hydrolase [Streptomyces malaysiensis]